MQVKEIATIGNFEPSGGRKKAGNPLFRVITAKENFSRAEGGAYRLGNERRTAVRRGDQYILKGTPYIESGIDKSRVRSLAAGVRSAEKRIGNGIVRV